MIVYWCHTPAPNLTVKCIVDGLQLKYWSLLTGRMLIDTSNIVTDTPHLLQTVIV